MRRHLATSATFCAVLGAISHGPALAAPAPPVVSTPTQHSFVGDPLVTISGSVDGAAVLVRIFEGAAVLADTGPIEGFWSASVGLPDGAHTIAVQARDASGTWSAPSAARTFAVDNTNPAPPAITVPSNGDVVPFSTITVEGTTEPFAHVVVTDANGPVLYATANASGLWEVAHDFGDANHSLTAVAIDRAGNDGQPSAAVQFAVDTTAPGAPTITMPGPATITNNTTVPLAGTAERGSTVTVFSESTTVVTTAASDGTWTSALTVAEGTHTIWARAVDAVGNRSSASREVTFTVDLTAPAAPVLLTPKQGAYVAAPVTITGRTEPFARVQLSSSTDSWTNDADKLGAFSFTLALEDGSHSFTARATDRAGNVGPASAPLTFTADAGPPQVWIETPDGTVILPGRIARLTGYAVDEIGVAGVRLDYYDVRGALVHRQNATCGACPGRFVDWFAELGEPIGFFEVRAYAIDLVGRSSPAATVTILNL